MKKFGKKNMYEIQTPTCHVLISYDTPVAFHSLVNNTCYITEKRWSHTTSGHISRWLIYRAREHNGNVVEKIDQISLDKMFPKRYWRHSDYNDITTFYQDRFEALILD